MTMPSPSRLMIIVVILAVLGGAGFVGWQQQTQIQGLQQTARGLRGRVSQAQTDAEALQAQLTQADADRHSLTERLDAARQETAQAQDALRAVQAQLVDWSSRYSAAQQEKEALVAQLAATAKEQDGAKQQMTQLQAQKARLEGERAELQQRLSALTEEIVQLKQQVAAAPPSRASGAAVMRNGAIQLPSIVVRPGGVAGADTAESADTAQQPARVVEMNAQYRFLVIDQGSADGVFSGMVFDVVHDGATVGSVTAKQVREHLTACDLDASSASSSFRIGDLAMPRRN